MTAVFSELFEVVVASKIRSSNKGIASALVLVGACCSNCVNTSLLCNIKESGKPANWAT